MKRIFTSFLLLLALVGAGQNVTTSWLKRFGGTDPQGVVSIATDAAGNIYSTGYFTGSGDFDPGPGVSNLSATGITDVFIKKDDPNGNLIWVKQISGDQSTRSTSVALDASGNVYVSGYYFGNADLDPGPGTQLISNINPNAIYNAFVCKLDNTGQFIWGKSIGEPNSACFILSIAVDGPGNLHGTGMFAGVNIDFDPGPGFYPFTSVTQDGFVLKLDPAGNFGWAAHFFTSTNIYSSSGTFSNSIALDAAGNVYTTGNFNDTVDFDPGPGEYKLYTDDVNGENPGMFISKLDANGQFVFARQFEGGGDSKSIAVDAAGNILTTGFLETPVDFDPGPAEFILTNSIGRNGFVSKLDAAGNFVWAKQLIGNTTTGNAVTTDPSGNVYVIGDFLDITDFDPGPLEYVLNPSQWDIFTLKLTAAGDFAWAKMVTGCGNDFGYDILTTPDGCVLTAGYLESAPAYADQIRDTKAGNTGYIQRLCPCTSCPATLCLGNRVWKDVNNNGFDNNEPGMPGLQVYLYRDENNDNEPDQECVAAYTFTDENGNYSFCNLQPGNYMVGVLIPFGYANSKKTGGDPDNNIDLDNNGNQLITLISESELRGRTITLVAGAEPGGNSNNTYDIGLAEGPLTLGNRVWNDLNNNGRDNHEPGLEGVAVNVYKLQHNNDPITEGEFIAGTITDENGYYSFTQLFPGIYRVVVERPAGFRSSTPNGGDPDNNKDKDDNGIFSDETNTWGLGITLTKNQEPGGNTNNTYDFGFTTAEEDEECDDETNQVVAANETPVQIKSAYPNPFSSMVNLQLQAKESMVSKISLIAPDGSLIRQYNKALFAGTNTLTIENTEKLPAGIYTILVQAGELVIRRRVVKQ